jgi:hypothetical protein
MWNAKSSMTHSHAVWDTSVASTCNLRHLQVFRHLHIIWSVYIEFETSAYSLRSACIVWGSHKQPDTPACSLRHPGTVWDTNETPHTETPTEFQAHIPLEIIQNHTQILKYLRHLNSAWDICVQFETPACSIRPTYSQRHLHTNWAMYRQSETPTNCLRNQHTVWDIYILSETPTYNLRYLHTIWGSYTVWDT